MQLYGPEIMIYNFHNLKHLVEDYERFGSLEDSSGFPFENFLGKLKYYVHAGNKPLEQIINVYSGYVRTKQFAVNGQKEAWDQVAEFYEQPLLHNSVKDEVAERAGFNRFSEVCFRNYCLKSNNLRDCFCFVGDDKYVHVEKILQKKVSGEVYIEGQYFQTVENLFEEPCCSKDVGISVCDNPTSCPFLFLLSRVEVKCYGFPFREKCAMVQYLH